MTPLPCATLTTVDADGKIEIRELTHADINHPPAPRFMWRSHDDTRRYVDEMETRHLFYTLRMVWNHSMPEEARSASYKRYSFSPFYTAEYMQDAIRYICRELSTRKNLDPAWQVELDRFAAYLMNRRKLLTEVPE